MIGGLFEGYNDLETKGILVWGEPWSVDGYENYGGVFEGSGDGCW